MLENYFHYFSHKVNREVKEVYWQTLIANLALSLVFIFEPIYLFTLGYSFIQILWYYVWVYVAYTIFIGFGAKITSKIGYKHSIFISGLVYVLYWITLYSVRSHPVLFFAAPVLFAMQKSFFWPAYDADIAVHDGRDQRGREVGFLFSVIQVTFIVAPIIAGVISEQFGYLTLFVIASIFMASSSWPLFRTRDTFDRHEFRFKELWKIFRQHPYNFFGYWGFAEDLMIMSLWPVYIYTVLPKASTVGMITTVAMLIATVLMLYIGKRSDHGDKRDLIQKASWFYSMTWLARSLAINAPTVLIFDILNKSAKGLLNIPMMALTYEIAGSKDRDFAVAYSVFFEFSLAIGKIITALGGIAILYYTNNIFLVFTWVGLLTLCYGFLRKK